MKLSDIGAPISQLPPEQAVITATALSNRTIKIGEASPVSLLIGVTLGLGLLAYIIMSKD